MTRKWVLTAASAAIVAGAVLMTGMATAHESDHDGPGWMQGHGMMMGPGYGGGPGMGYGMGPGMMGPGYGGGPGMGYGMGPGMMAPGAMGYGMAPCAQQSATLDKALTVEDVTRFLQSRLDHMGNDRLKVGKVVSTDDKTITAEIITKDDSLVQKLAFDKATGRHQMVR